jgi:predicted GIY-YIG superfamily endonuclease
MHYVYILQSDADERRFYTGLTNDLRKRLRSHNAGHVAHTAKWKPWHLKTYVAFQSRTRASEFEQYLKSASGRAFARKRLRQEFASQGARRPDFRHRSTPHSTRDI